MTSSVLLVDDHALVRHGLASLLATTHDFAVVGEAADGALASQRVTELAPDIVVIDLLMPGVNGVSAIRAIRAASPGTTLVVLTSVEEGPMALAAIEAGAHAFLLKSMSGDELLAALRRTVQGEVYIHPVVARTLLHAVRERRHPVVDPFAELTTRELDVLKALGDGASNARLGDLLSISEKTVKSHIGNILAKLRLADRTEAVAFAWRNGLMRGDSHDD